MTPPSFIGEKESGWTTKGKMKSETELREKIFKVRKNIRFDKKSKNLLNVFLERKGTPKQIISQSA